MHRRIWLAGLATLVVLLGVNCDAQSDSRAHDLASAQRYGPRESSCSASPRPEVPAPVTAGQPASSGGFA